MAIPNGCHRIGERIIDTLAKLGKKILVVDFDPEVIEKLEARNINHLYGDMGDKEILERVNLGSCDLVVSTVPDLGDNLTLLKYAKIKIRRTANNDSLTPSSKSFGLFKKKKLTNIIIIQFKTILNQIKNKNKLFFHLFLIGKNVNMTMEIPNIPIRR